MRLPTYLSVGRGLVFQADERRRGLGYTVGKGFRDDD